MNIKEVNFYESAYLSTQNHTVDIEMDDKKNRAKFMVERSDVVDQDLTAFKTNMIIQDFIDGMVFVKKEIRDKRYGKSELPKEQKEKLVPLED